MWEFPHSKVLQTPAKFRIHTRAPQTNLQWRFSAGHKSILLTIKFYTEHEAGSSISRKNYITALYILSHFPQIIKQNLHALRLLPQISRVCGSPRRILFPVITRMKNIALPARGRIRR